MRIRLRRWPSSSRNQQTPCNEPSQIIMWQLAILILGLGGPCSVFQVTIATLGQAEVKMMSSPISIELGYWIEGQSVEWSYLFDSQTVSMLIPVLSVSALVQLYSAGYMSSDPHLPRFFSYQSLFTLFMLFLVTGENLLVQFLGWEGVGIASYLLINFWSTRLVANFAALKAFLMNRVGDYSIVLGLLLTAGISSDLSIGTLFTQALYLNGDQQQILAILMLIGASAKSAQLGLHAWLPSAMEGQLLF